MGKGRFVCGAAIVIAIMVVCVPQFVRAQNITDLVKKTRPSIVKLRVYDALHVEIGVASGFFFQRNVIITNHHVVEKAAAIDAVMYDSTIIPVKSIIVSDSVSDIAMLDVVVPSAMNITTLKIEEKYPEIGERVLVISNPLGLEQTVSDGIVSSIRKAEKGHAEAIQFTAPISSGSSGSPVMNMQGRAIAVVRSVIQGGQNLNFSTPSKFLYSLTPGAVIPFASVEKEYGGKMMLIKDAFVVDSVSSDSLPDVGTPKEKNLALLVRIALRRGWDSTVITDQQSRMARLTKRYAEKDLEKDVLTTNEAMRIIDESIGTNDAQKVKNDKLHTEQLYLQALLREAARYMDKRSKATPAYEFAMSVKDRHQEMIGLEEGKNYYFISMANDECIADLDVALFQRDGAGWKAVASDTDPDAQPRMYLTVEKTGEYALIWRVARNINDCHEGTVGTIIVSLEE